MSDPCFGYHAEMEKGCLPFLCNFWHFGSFLHDFEHFLHIFCVLIFNLEVVPVLLCNIFNL